MLCFVKVALSWPLLFDLCSVVLQFLTGLFKFITPQSSKPGYSLFYPLQLTPALLIFIDVIKFFLSQKSIYFECFFVCFIVQFINTSLVHLESSVLTLEIPDLQQKVFTEGSSFFQSS